MGTVAICARQGRSQFQNPRLGIDIKTQKHSLQSVPVFINGKTNNKQSTRPSTTPASALPKPPILQHRRESPLLHLLSLLSFPSPPVLPPRTTSSPSFAAFLPLRSDLPLFPLPRV